MTHFFPGFKIDTYEPIASVLYDLDNASFNKLLNEKCFGKVQDGKFYIALPRNTLIIKNFCYLATMSLNCNASHNETSFEASKKLIEVIMTLAKAFSAYSEKDPKVVLRITTLGCVEAIYQEKK